MQHPEESMQITCNLQHALAHERYANDKNFSADTDHAHLWRHLKALFMAWRFSAIEFYCDIFKKKKRSVMSRKKKRSAFDQVSEFDRKSIVAYRDCGLSFGQIFSPVARNQTTLMRICDRWMQQDTRHRPGQ
ncbi:HTH_38 domain-containing protein [Trichonephila clavipes]|nr:HTH_38 domain-containing protein [Trichonephila clavipes]